MREVTRRRMDPVEVMVSRLKRELQKMGHDISEEELRKMIDPRLSYKENRRRVLNKVRGIVRVDRQFLRQLANVMWRILGEYLERADKIQKAAELVGSTVKDWVRGNLLSALENELGLDRRDYELFIQRFDGNELAILLLLKNIGKIVHAKAWRDGDFIADVYWFDRSVRFRHEALPKQESMKALKKVKRALEDGLYHLFYEAAYYPDPEGAGEYYSERLEAAAEELGADPRKLVGLVDKLPLDSTTLWDEVVRIIGDTHEQFERWRREKAREVVERHRHELGELANDEKLIEALNDALVAAGAARWDLFLHDFRRILEEREYPPELVSKLADALAREVWEVGQEMDEKAKEHAKKMVEELIGKISDKDLLRILAQSGAKI